MRKALVTATALISFGFALPAFAQAPATTKDRGRPARLLPKAIMTRETSTR